MLSRWNGDDGLERTGRGEAFRRLRASEVARARLWRLASIRLRHDLGGVADDEALTLLFTQISLYILRGSRGPMRLWDFSQRLMLRLGMKAASSAQFCDAVRATIVGIGHPRLRVLAPPSWGTGAGYVYDAADPGSWPVHS